MSTLLIKSGWQAVNIGDTGHTPGILRILKENFKDTRIILWIEDDSMGVRAMLKHYFPDLEIVKGSFRSGKFSTPELEKAFNESDMLIQASSPFIHEEYLKNWMEFSDKPFGIFGTTFDKSEEKKLISPNSCLREILDKAAFIFARETKSLNLLKEMKPLCPVVAYTPDVCVASEIADEKTALAYLEENGLASGEYLCATPRLRLTPYHYFRWGTNWSTDADIPQFHQRHGRFSQKRIKEIEETNAKHRERDMSKMRSVICKWVRTTGKKVLLCPEMIDHIYLFGSDIYTKLPEDVKEKIVIKDSFWLTDEAAAIYKHSLALLSMDCHSPLLAFAQNTPAIYLRLEGSTSKGQMYRDFGLQDWIMELDESNADEIAERVIALTENRKESLTKLGNALTKIREEHKIACNIIKKILTN